MNLQTFQRGSDRIACITLYGDNRSPEVTEWHRRVMVEHFGVPVNYLKCPFPGVSHGACMNHVLNQTVDTAGAPDHYLWLDNDCIALCSDAIDLAYQASRDRMTVWGQAWQSNHLTGPNGMIPHAYASQACLMYACELYVALGRPDMDHWQPHCDTAESLTYAAKRAGYNVSLLYPSHSVLADTPLDNGMRYGMGNTYGPLTKPLWHHTSSCPNPRHVEVFMETCKRVLEGRYAEIPYGGA